MTLSSLATAKAPGCKPKSTMTSGHSLTRAK
jgi:hypothetical protein